MNKNVPIHIRAKNLSPFLPKWGANICSNFVSARNSKCYEIFTNFVLVSYLLLTRGPTVWLPCWGSFLTWLSLLPLGSFSTSCHLFFLQDSSFEKRSSFSFMKVAVLSNHSFISPFSHKSWLLALTFYLSISHGPYK